MRGPGPGHHARVSSDLALGGDDAGEGAAVGQFEQGRAIAFEDLGRGVEDRLDQVGAVELAGDEGEVGAPCRRPGR